ncbi:MAG: hypothetical protein PHV59_01605 [Victivallales bacterium]|nr:hypothetical protein [Victivallales bacterium]
MTYFKSNYERSRLFLRIAIFLGVVSIVQPVLIIRLLHEADEKKVIVMDDADNFHLVKSEPFKTAQKVQLECVKFAVKSLLGRSPKGVDDPVGIEQAFLMKNCAEQIKKLIEKEQREFEKKHIVQNCEIGRIHVLRQKEGCYLANVTGQLIRTCTYMNHSYVDAKWFRLGLILCKNPDISANGKMPLCVVRITHYETGEKK